MKNLLILVLTYYVSQLNSTEQHARPKSLETIYSEIRGYVQQFPRLAKIVEIGKSLEKRPIYCVEIHDRSVRHNLTIVLIFGIHPREWASQNSAVFSIGELLRNTELRHCIQTTKWMIVPVMNPDGYLYSTNTFSLWRKNRRSFLNSKCVGVDLNRNFPVGWERTEKDRCQPIYSGSTPLSEPESQVLKNFLETVNNTDAYVDVHSCAQSILLPYGYTKSKPSHDALRRIVEAAEDMKAAMKKTRGTKYVVQSAADLYVAGGSSFDFVFKEMKVPLVFTLELGDRTPGRNREDTLDCFHPSASKMVLLQRECLQAILALNEFLVREEPSKGEDEKSNSASAQKGSQESSINPVWSILIPTALFQVLSVHTVKC